MEGIDAAVVGHLVIELGGGRLKKTDVLDHAVGLQFLKVIGDEISPGDPWAVVHHNTPLTDAAIERLQGALVTGEKPTSRRNRVLEIIGHSQHANPI